MSERHHIRGRLSGRAGDTAVYLAYSVAVGVVGGTVCFWWLGWPLWQAALVGAFAPVFAAASELVDRRVGDGSGCLTLTAPIWGVFLLGSVWAVVTVVGEALEFLAVG